MKFSEKITILRKINGLTQASLADKIGVTDKAVSKWETGLGCPDVSILEILSKELDCSILELLKGREIIDEVIPVTEMDDYIKEGLQYGENNFKKIISNIIAAIIIFIVAILFILNVINIYNQRKTYYNSNDISLRNIERFNELSKNINIIEKNKGIYSDEDYNTIMSLLHNTQGDISSSIYMNDHDAKYTVSDFFTMDRLGINYSNVITLNRILAKYDRSVEDNIETIVISIGTRMMLGSSMEQQPYDLIYRYQIVNYTSSYYNPIMSLQARQYDIYYRLGLYVDVTKAIIEVGDIHE